MAQPIFVNFKDDFVSRIRAEAGPQALVTPSMIQALRWISNGEVPISGIYVNPNDGTYSTFRFLEAVFHQRPATPLFLIDDENDVQTEAQMNVLRAARIRQIFKGDETYEELIAPLQLGGELPLRSIQKRTPQQRSEHEGYLAIPIIDFLFDQTYPFDVFVVDETNQLRLFGIAGDKIEPEYLSHLAQTTAWLFAAEATLQNILSNIRKTESGYMKNEQFPLAWKTAETLYKAKQLLDHMKKGGLSDSIVEQSHHLLGDVFLLVSQLSHAARLNTFVDQAKQCDRTMACATLSILMCRTLKFEKNSIVEILGLASFFQDVSLYNSPFGNLTECSPKDLSAQATAYYLQHPSLSADLLAQHTSIPDVTLQVMRQHHERKDRTGFPNRVGGMQLHPMSEVLSLINTYLDHDHTLALDSHLFAHYSDRVVHAFKDLLCVLGHQESNRSA